MEESEASEHPGERKLYQIFRTDKYGAARIADCFRSVLSYKRRGKKGFYLRLNVHHAQKFPAPALLQSASVDLRENLIYAACGTQLLLITRARTAKLIKLVPLRDTSASKFS